MPNVVSCVLSVIGPPSVVAQFVEQARAPSPYFPDIQVPLNFYALVPPRVDDVKKELSAVGFAGEQAVSPSGKLLSAEYEAWGVRSGAQDSQEAEIADLGATYEFWTPWGPPGLFLDNVSQQWPTLLFLLSFDDPWPNPGYQVSFRGSRDANFELPERPRLPEPTGDNGSESYQADRDAFEQQFIRTHDTWVAEVGQLFKATQEATWLD